MPLYIRTETFTSTSSHRLLRYQLSNWIHSALRMLRKVTFLLVVLVGSSLAQEYGTDDQAARAQQLSANYVRQSYNPNLYEDAKAEPYDFGFQSTDEYGTVMNRQESSDNNGAVRGSYGYTDPYGVFRHVDYVADEYGFRAQVKSNEPGMGSQSPANVEIYAEAPPAGVIVDRPYYGHQQSGQGQVQPQPQRRNPAPVNPARQNRPSAQAGTRSPSSSGGRPTQQAGPFPFVPSSQNPYPSAASNQFPTTINRYAGGNPYPARSPYLSTSATQYNPQGASASSASSSSGASQAVAAGSSNQATGYRYPVGNPHVTNYAKADTDKAESGSILLPTVVASGVPTLVKHIHTYPVTTV